ncbi:MAG: efflux RND transporter permease subunit, partial [Alphaproteobacteria bacterium]|nr:efflux RND transporter permease subunit [Alphaproteobacteria bacterium]
MTGLVDWAIDRARLTLSILVAVLVMGTLAYISIPKEADPDIPLPFFQVQVVLPGISPEDSERLLVRPLEVQLKTIEGLKEIRGIASQGYGAVSLEFDVNFNKDRALQKVRDAVDAAKSKLPNDAEEPFIFEANVSDSPVVSIILSGNVPERALLRAAKRMEREIDSIVGVLDAELSGQREELLEVIIDPARLDSYGVSSEDLFRLVVRNNQLIPAGSLDTGRGRFAVKVPGLFETADDVLRLPVKVQGDGVVKLGDIAQVRRTFYDANTFARYNGRPAISIDVKKRTGANIVGTIALVRKYVESVRAEIPAGVRVDYSGDASYWIDAQLTQLTNAILLAIALVMIIVVASLGLRSGLIVGISIPASFLIGFLCLYFGGFTLNMMILFGMVITVGLLVDNGIIVVEYADRKMAEGFSKREAFSEAGRRMFWPVVSSTATTLAAFAPMLFWPGVSGKFMSYLPFTMIFIMTASMFVALLFLPTIGAIFGKPEKIHPNASRDISLSETGNLYEISGLTGFYVRLVTGAVNRPFFVLLIAVVSLVAVVIAFIAFNKGVQFFVETDADFATVSVRARGNLSALEKRDLVIEAERRLTGARGVKGVYTVAGAGGGGRGGAVDTIGRIFIELQPYRDRGPSKPIMAELRKRLENMPGIFAELQEQESGPPGGKAIQIEVGSESYAALDRVVAAVRAHADKMPGLIDIEDSRPLPGIEWNIKLDREQAGRFGADVGTVGAAV